MERLLKVEEVAELLALPVKTVYHLAGCGLIPSKKIGKHRRFDRDELEVFVKKNKG
jgi:excisionase family DNA binding protein